MHTFCIIACRFPERIRSNLYLPRYTILPIQFSIEQFYERQLNAAEQAQERQRAEKRKEQHAQKEVRNDVVVHHG